MATDLHVVQTYDAGPQTIYDTFADRSFQEGRLTAAGGIDPEVSELEVTGSGADRTITVVTKQAIPASVLPSMVASMVPGDPLIVRTEKWRAGGSGYVADFDVVIKGAPASLSGTMALADDPDRPGGSTLTVDGQTTVPIPLFGPKIEGVIVEQVSKLLDAEENYTRSALGG